MQRSVAVQAHHPDAVTKKVYFDVKIGNEDIGRWAPHACMEGASDFRHIMAYLNSVLHDSKTESPSEVESKRS